MTSKNKYFFTGAQETQTRLDKPDSDISPFFLRPSDLLIFESRLTFECEKRRASQPLCPLIFIKLTKPVKRQKEWSLISFLDIKIFKSQAKTKYIEKKTAVWRWNSLRRHTHSLFDDLLMHVAHRTAKNDLKIQQFLMGEKARVDSKK